MEFPINSFKIDLAQDKLQIGLWSNLCSPIVAEVISDSGFDWIVIDAEHSPNELPVILAQIQAMQGGAANPVIRPPWNDAVLIKRLLDIGVQTLLVPFVQTADEARRAVAATRYPPAGIRGITNSGRASRYGRVQGYLQRANEHICVLVQLETAEAVANLEHIAAIDGVDGIFIGPSDLAASLGHLGNPSHPDVQAVIESAAKRLTALGKPAGILTAAESDARRYIEWGFRFVAVGTDLNLLTKNADALARLFKAGPDKA